MQREATAHLELDATSDVTLVLEIAAAAYYDAPGSLIATASGRPVFARELVGAHGDRWHVLDVPAGPVTIDYSTSISGRVPPTQVDEYDRLHYLRPSRYCESDTLAPTAHAEFSGLSGPELLPAVSSWVGTRLSYVPGSSQPTDGAVNTLLARQGVCRDYAHLVIALLRALDVPARLVSVYAPGLEPMDFHAVAEAYVEGRWCVVDATALAPRETFIRIATGQDAADTAFLSVHHGRATLRTMHVTAVADSLPDDDITRLVSIG